MERKLVLIISLIQLFNLSCLFAMQQGGSFECVWESQESIDDLEVMQKNKEEKHKLFLAAIMHNKKNAFKNLVHDKDLNINEEDKDGRTPLFWAVDSGDPDIVKELLANGDIDINKADKYGRTPLFWAVDWGNTVIVKELLADVRININKAGEDGRAPLFRAVDWGDVVIVKELLADGRIDVGKVDSKGETALDIAKKRCSSSIIEMLEQKQQSTLARLFGKTMNPFRFFRSKR